MTSPGNPLDTLSDALDTYTKTQEIMQAASNELRPTENATRLAVGLPALDEGNGPVPSES